MNKYQKALNNIRFYCGNANCDEYLNPKVFEELNIIQELVDKETPKKPSFLNYGGYKLGNWHCPNCNSIIILDSRKPKQPKRCEECDQLLDWSDTNE